MRVTSERSQVIPKLTSELRDEVEAVRASKNERHSRWSPFAQTNGDGSIRTTSEDKEQVRTLLNAVNVYKLTTERIMNMVQIFPLYNIVHIVHIA